MKSLKVALLYNHEPSGHSFAAGAIEEELRARDPRTEVVRLNLSDKVHPVLGPLVAKTYLAIATAIPSLWDYLYDNAEVADSLEGFMKLVRHAGSKRIREFIREHRPDAVISTQALPCSVVAEEKRNGRISVPLIGALTDFNVHQYWVAKGVDRFLVASDEARRDLSNRGIPEERVVVTGIPVRRAFAHPKSKDAARRALRIENGRPVVLITGGTRGLGDIEKAVEALSKVRPRPELVVSCGNNDSLHRKLRRLELPNLHLHKRLNERMADAMAAADLMVGKAGGVTASEALAVGLPMLLFAPLPGQEELNVRWLTRHGAAIRIKDEIELVREAARLLGDAGPRRRMAEKAKRLGRPDSAARACDALLSLLRR